MRKKVVEDEEGQGWGEVGGRLGDGMLWGEAGGYLESLPVGPNHSDGMFSPGLLL